MQNPWRNLPPGPPFVAPADAESVRQLAPRLQGPYQLKLDLLPQPWTGNLNTAEVFMLALNPGFAEVDYDDLRDPDYSERLTLSFETRTPIYFLDPAFANTSGFQWWHRRLRELIAVAGLEAVARKGCAWSTSPTNLSATSRRPNDQRGRAAMPEQKEPNEDVY